MSAGELVPYADAKQQAVDAYNTTANTQFDSNYYPGNFSAEQITQLQKRVDLHVYFGVHDATVPDTNAAHEVIRHARTEDFTIIEKYGYNPDENAAALRDGSPDNPLIAQQRAQAAESATRVLTAIKAGEQPHVDAFTFVANYCRARRIPLARADFDAFDALLWQQAQEHTATSLPTLPGVTQEFFNNTAPSLDFYSASGAYRTALANANRHDHRTGRTEYRYGEVIRQRERMAVNASAHLMLGQLAYHQSSDPLTVRAFYGLSHEGGILERLDDLKLPVKSHVMTTSEGYQPTDPTAANRERHAYRFATSYFWYETRQGAAIGNEQDFQGLAIALREIPISHLETLYEQHRLRVQWIFSSTQNVALREQYFGQIANVLGQELNIAWRLALAARGHR